MKRVFKVYFMAVIGITVLVNNKVKPCIFTRNMGKYYAKKIIISPLRICALISFV